MIKSFGKSILRLFPTVPLAVGCSAAAVFELILVGVRRTGYSASTPLAWPVRCALVLVTVLSWISLGWLWSWLRLALARPGCPAWLRRGGRIVVTAVLCAGLLAYASSIVLYWRTGMFADSDTIRFLLVNAGMLTHYMVQSEAFVLAVLTVVAVSGLVLFSRGNPKRGSGSDAIVGGGINWIGMAAILLYVELILALSFLFPPVILKPTEPWWTNARGLDFELRSRSSPALSLIAGALLPGEEVPEKGIPVDSLRRIDRSPVATTITKQPPRSIILIAIESLRHDVIGASHLGREIMPQLSQMAHRGRWFTRAYSQSTHSDYADPCLVSSLYPLRSPRHHYYQTSDPWPKVLVYDVLKEAGYSTALFSSQNESWGNMANFLESPALDVFFDSRQRMGETHFSEKDPGFARFVGQARVAGKLDDALTADEAIRWVRGQAADSHPFFLYLNFQSSHFPYEIRTAARPFQPSDIDFDASFASYPAAKVEVVRNAYFNALHYIDQQLGKLMDALADLNLSDETLVVVAGDNGEAFYENGHPTHAGPPFEPAIHVGLVFHCPALLGAARETGIAQAIDIAPTILGLLQAPSQPCFQGNDLFLPENGDMDGRVALIHCESVLSGSEAIVSQTGWKYVVNRRTNDAALYLLDVDPCERNNLEHREQGVARLMGDAVERWREQQLAYYALQKYYGFFYPPKAPCLSEAEIVELRRRASAHRALNDP
jgi:arylsulfatase A-like enzyme